MPPTSHFDYCITSLTSLSAYCLTHLQSILLTITGKGSVSIKQMLGVVHTVICLPIIDFPFIYANKTLYIYIGAMYPVKNTHFSRFAMTSFGQWYVSRSLWVTLLVTLSWSYGRVDADFCPFSFLLISIQNASTVAGHLAATLTLSGRNTPSRVEKEANWRFWVSVSTFQLPYQP